MGCPGCGLEYSFYFGRQFHKIDCPVLKEKEGEKDDCAVEE